MLRLRFAPLSMTGSGALFHSVMLSGAKHLIPLLLSCSKVVYRPFSSFANGPAGASLL